MNLFRGPLRFVVALVALMATLVAIAPRAVDARSIEMGERLEPVSNRGVLASSSFAAAQCNTSSTSVSTALLIDRSKSMESLVASGNSRFGAAKEAANQYVDQNNGPNDQVAVVTFSGTVGPGIALKPVNGNQASIKQTISNLPITPVDDGTSYTVAVTQGSNELRAASGSNVKAIILLTDGYPTEATPSNYVQNLAGQAKSVQARLFTVGLGLTGGSASAADKLLGDIASAGNGIYYPSPDGSNLPDIYSTINKIVRGCPDNNPANVWGGVQADLNLQAAPGALVSYSLHVKNWGKGAAQRVRVDMAFDPNLVSIVDAKFPRSDMWVSDLITNSLTIRLGSLFPQSEATGTIRFRVLSTAASGGKISMQPKVSWDDGITSAKDAMHLGNTLTTTVGAQSASGEATMTATQSGSKLSVSGGGFAPWEAVDTWYDVNGKGTAAGRFLADGSGNLKATLDPAGAGYKNGTFRIVARGVYSYDTKVGMFNFSAMKRNRASGQSGILRSLSVPKTHR